jgi:hypothetical protein
LHSNLFAKLLLLLSNNLKIFLSNLVAHHYPLTPTLTDLPWLSNPAKNRTLSSYPHSVGTLYHHQKGCKQYVIR